MVQSVLELEPGAETKKDGQLVHEVALKPENVLAGHCRHAVLFQK
jgi:hypothetical protein